MGYNEKRWQIHQINCLPLILCLLVLCAAVFVLPGFGSQLILFSPFFPSCLVGHLGCPRVLLLLKLQALLVVCLHRSCDDSDLHQPRGRRPPGHLLPAPAPMERQHLQTSLLRVPDLHLALLHHQPCVQVSTFTPTAWPGAGHGKNAGLG